MVFLPLQAPITMQAMPDYTGGSSLFDDAEGRAGGGVVYTVTADLVMDTAQHAVFDAFYKNDCKHGLMWFTSAVWSAQIGGNAMSYQFAEPPVVTKTSGKVFSAKLKLTAKNTSTLTSVSNGLWPDFACPEMGATSQFLPVNLSHSTLLNHTIRWRNGLGAAYSMSGMARFDISNVNEWVYFYEAVRTAVWLTPAWRFALAPSTSALKVRFFEPPTLTINGNRVEVSFKLFGLEY